jgi:hypothetical protein
MGKSVIFDLEQSRKRLDYYSQLKEKSGPDAPATVSKWIEIYTERMQKLEQQVQMSGLKTRIESSNSVKFDQF